MPTTTLGESVAARLLPMIPATLGGWKREALSQELRTCSPQLGRQQVWMKMCRVTSQCEQYEHSDTQQGRAWLVRVQLLSKAERGSSL